MSLVVNHNLMAMNAARNLNTIYSRLSTSTQRLSSGLRINSAADDAAGLAIREMMRADIAVLNQGMRNASDAISMIQTAEGALSVIDEKLIRMKELSEQASTGTYTTAQREIMNSEYQAMAAEIDRIANATDFNGIKLLDGSVQYQHDGSGLKIHFGTGNDADEDYYFINMGDARATTATGLKVGGDAKNDIWGQGGVDSAGGVAGCCGLGGYTSLDGTIANVSGQSFAYYYDYDGTAGNQETNGAPMRTGDKYSYLAGVYQAASGSSLQDIVNAVNAGTQSRIKVDFRNGGSAGTALGLGASTSGALNICLGDETYQFISGGNFSGDTTNLAVSATIALAGNVGTSLASAINANSKSFFAILDSSSDVWVFKKDGGNFDFLEGCDVGLGVNGSGGTHFVNWVNAGTYSSHSAGTTFANGGLDWGTMTTKQFNNGSWGADLHGLNVGEGYDLQIANVGSAGNTAADIQFTDGAGSGLFTQLTGFRREDFNEVQDATNAPWVGADIRTQSAAQESLDAIATAIEKKDKIRADLGALQNRLENTMTNIGIQAENLQASESRISDIDVATEMTEFTRNNIMAQAATSMLAQANSLAQLALSLMG